MKKNKFKVLYYTGLSIILSIVSFVTVACISLTIIVFNEFNKPKEIIVQMPKIEKSVIYDTVKVQVQVLDTIKVTQKKIKPVVKLVQKSDSI